MIFDEYDIKLINQELELFFSQEKYQKYKKKYAKYITNKTEQEFGCWRLD